MKKIYNTRGTCARQILLDINDDKTVNSVEFVGGCNGNKIDDVISSLKGIDCNFKGTSCPDQLAKALEEVKEEL